MEAIPTERAGKDAGLDWLPLMLQTADPLFPTGAYAHSLGFEECVRLGLVHDEKTLRTFLREQVTPALEHFDLPYLRFAFEALAADDFDVLLELAEEIGAAKLAGETRSASTRLGGRRLTALQSILPGEPLLAAFGRAVAEERLAGHHLVVCALQGVLAGAPLGAVLTGYFYQSHAALAGAALKLLRIGQDGVQRALRAAVAESAEVVERSRTIQRAEAGCFNPLLEIASMRHERAVERLFIS